MRRKTITSTLAAVAICVGTCFSARAAILLTPPDYQNVQNPNTANLYPLLEGRIAAWNTANPGNPLPAAGPVDQSPILLSGFSVNPDYHASWTAPGSGPISATFDFAAHPAQYLVLTWDGRNGGTQFFYVGTDSGSVTFNSPVFADGLQHGLSGYMMTPVPEPTTLVAGVGAIGLLLFGARTRSKQSGTRSV